MATAWHILNDIGASTVGAIVSVDPLHGGSAIAATVRSVDELHDLAVLVRAEPLPASIGALGATDVVRPKTDIVITGVPQFVDKHTYRYTTTAGSWQGTALRDDQVALGQLDANSVVPGMSGGPVRRLVDDQVIGVVSSRYNSIGHRMRDTVWIARTEDLIPLLVGVSNVVISAPRPHKTLAAGALDSIVRSVVVNAFSRTGRQIDTASKEQPAKKGRTILKDLGLVLTAHRPSEMTELTTLPNNLSKEEFERFFESPIIQGIAQELLAAKLAGAGDSTLEHVRQSFRFEATHAFSSVASEAVGAVVDPIFDALAAEADAACQETNTDLDHLAQQVRDDLRFRRVVYVLEGIERHAERLSEYFQDTDRNDFLERYRRQVRMAHGYITPPDFDRRRDVPIDRLYVSPSIVMKGSDAATPITEVQLDVDRTVLLGDPGGGKSTVSGVLMHHRAGEPDGPIPFLVTLREFAAGPITKSVIQYLEQRLDTYYQCPAPHGSIEALLLSGRALVIFDGLDELLDTARRREVTEIVSLFCSAYPLALTLVTSRRVGYEQAPMDPLQFDVYELSGFDDTRVERYVENWFQNDASLRPDEEARWTKAFMSESSSVPDLRSNPLLLALMCIIFRGEKSLPKNRPAVYERCATLLFDKWDSSRRIHMELRAGSLVDPAMKYLAYWLLTNDDNQMGVPEQLLIREAANYLHERSFENEYEATTAAREFVEFCRGRAWVFSDAGSTAEGESLYKFTHRTFMEYFAASHLVRISGTPEKLGWRIAHKVAKAEWDVVAQLSVQIVDRSTDLGAQRVFEYLLQRCERFKLPQQNDLLGFLGRCLAFSAIPPKTLRKLVAASVAHSHAFAQEHSSVLFAHTTEVPRALGWIIYSVDGSALEVVRDELRLQVLALCSSERPEDVSVGLALAFHGLAAAYMVYEKPDQRTDAIHRGWRKYFGDLQEEVGTSLARPFNMPIFDHFAVITGRIDLREYLSRRENGLADLFRVIRDPVFAVKTRPIAAIILREVVWRSPTGRRLALMQGWLEQIGSYLPKLGTPPWSGRFPEGFELVQPPENEINKANPIVLSQQQRIAAAVLFCIYFENEPSILLRWADLHGLGALDWLRPYLRARNGASRGFSGEIPLIASWARRKFSFTDN